MISSFIHHVCLSWKHWYNVYTRNMKINTMAVNDARRENKQDEVRALIRRLIINGHGDIAYKIHEQENKGK